MQRIGVVVHGPEIIDSGCALSLINYLQNQKQASVAAVLGGTMGRGAVIDAGLEDVISINPRQRPSQSILDLQVTSDVIFLLNQAKSRESGLVFGTMVAQAAGINKPLIQIDCGGRFVALLSGNESENEGERDLALQVASDLSLDCLFYPLLPSVTLGKNTTKRAISGVIPGELISINGIVIGRATEGQVEIEAKDGRIVGMMGANPKEHGLEKLSRFNVDLETAIIRSGSIRRSEAGLRVRVDEMANKGEEEWAVLIDHCAEDAFEAALGASLAVTVGDDTTQIAADILARLGIPVIGIVDGDLDHLVSTATMIPGSVVLQVMPGHDDLVGRQVKAEIFRGEKRICIRSDDLANKIKQLAGDHLVATERIKSDFS